jgi:hypothetical protein
MVNRNLTIIVIPPPEPGDVELPGGVLGSIVETDTTKSLSHFQALVGGNIEYVGPLLDGLISMVINEDGKYDSKLRPNIRATDLARGWLGIDDYIMGNAILVAGAPDGDGNTLGLTPNVVQLVMQLIPVKGAVGWLEEQRKNGA